MKILITGSCGFIGFSLAKYFLNKKYEVIGLDNMNNYYNPTLKKRRLKILLIQKKFKFFKVDISDKNKLSKIFKTNKFSSIYHLAAQAGVRYSIDFPDVYFKSNILGFYNLISLAKDYKSGPFFYASTSSVYGDQKKFPIKEEYDTNNPMSFYAASKKCNESMVTSFYNMYGMSFIGLRFFTVYGPFGRPDMSLFKFIDLALKNKKIELYNYGKHTRDFTYVDDVVKAIYLLHKKIHKNIKPINEIYNIGNSNPITLTKFIKTIENTINKKMNIKYLPMQKGDVEKTHSNSSKLHKFINFKPKTTIDEGVSKFYEWYVKYQK